MKYPKYSQKRFRLLFTNYVNLYKKTFSDTKMNDFEIFSHTLIQDLFQEIERLSKENMVNDYNSSIPFHKRGK